MALSRPLQIAISVAALVAAYAVYARETAKRDQLIEKGDECMTFGDADACATYDETVAKTPVWKLKLSLPKLPMTNLLGAKLDGGPPPDGYSWGGSY